MDHPTCKNCGNFRQHYTLDEKYIFRVYCGHCIVFKTRKVRPDTAVCEHFIPAPPQENAFAKKEYLSKELLQYLLHLELLPKIKDAPEE